jgi:hypothetical protein
MAAKVKWGLEDTSEPDSSDSGFYSGPMPPVQPYRVNLKSLSIKLDKNDNGRISGPAEIAEPKKSQASKYNGYTIWVGQSFSDHPRSKAYMLSLCEAIGVSWDDLMDKTVTEEKPNSTKPTKVIKIGRKKIEDLEMIVLTRTEKDQDNNPRLGIAQFKPADWDPDDDLDDDDEADEDDGLDIEDDDDDADDDADADDSDDDDADDDDDDDVDDDEEEEDDDDDDEEPEPAPKSRKSSARKPTPARKSATSTKKTSKPARKRRAADDDEDGEPPF